MEQFFSKKKCSATNCGTPIAEKFALECCECLEWFHGDCVAITKSLAAEMDANALQFTCNTCLENDREELTPCHTGVSSPHSNWNISDNDSEQKIWL